MLKIDEQYWAKYVGESEVLMEAITAAKTGRAYLGDSNKIMVVTTPTSEEGIDFQHVFNMKEDSIEKIDLYQEKNNTVRIVTFNNDKPKDG